MTPFLVPLLTLSPLSFLSWTCGEWKPSRNVPRPPVPSCISTCRGTPIVRSIVVLNFRYLLRFRGTWFVSFQIPPSLSFSLWRPDLDPTRKGRGRSPSLFSSPTLSLGTEEGVPLLFYPGYVSYVRTVLLYITTWTTVVIVSLVLLYRWLSKQVNEWVSKSFSTCYGLWRPQDP